MARVHSHYENLKVARDAPTEVIRAAYRVLAQRYHPDVNSSDDAARVMALLNEAWRVLSDTRLREEHDRWIRHREEEEALIDSAIEEAKAATRAASSSKTHKNAGDHQQSHTNISANPLARLSHWLGTPAGTKYGAFSIVAILVVGWIALTQHNNPQPIPKTSTISAAESPRAIEPTPSPHVSPPLAQTPSPRAAPQNKEWEVVSETPAPTLPRWSPNGLPFPDSAGYLQGLPRRAGGGLSKMTIDNTSGGADVYVKLCRASKEACNGLRHVFIPQGSTFTMLDVAPADYDIRYRNLTTGQISRSEPIEIREQETSEGTRYSVFRLTLYTVSGGNASFTTIPEEQF